MCPITSTSALGSSSAKKSPAANWSRAVVSVGGHRAAGLMTGRGEVLLATAGAYADQSFDLVDLLLSMKRTLIRKAYEALPEEGALIVYETISDDNRSKNAFGLLMSLNMLIETEHGFDYTAADCMGWMSDAGFTSTRAEHLIGRFDGHRREVAVAHSARSRGFISGPINTDAIHR